MPSGAAALCLLALDFSNLRYSRTSSGGCEMCDWPQIGDATKHAMACSALLIIAYFSMGVHTGLCYCMATKEYTG